MYSTRSTRRGTGLDKLFHGGDHVCHFGRYADELGEILIPYFKAGLEHNESCIWVAGHPYRKDRAISGMRVAVPDFDRRTATGQMLVVDQDEYFAKQPVMTAAEMVQGLLSTKDDAIGRGYAGLRIGGNAPRLDEGTWDEFMLYEQAVTDAFRDQPIIALCSYCMDNCAADGVFDAMHCHGLGIAKHRGHWGLVEVSDHQPEALHAGWANASGWQGADVRVVVEDQLAFFLGAYPERVGLEGGHVHLSEAEATRLGIVLYELAINAAKHGALSSRQGKLAVRWHVALNGSRRLHMKWTEAGLSGLAVPDKVGFGTRLIASAVENCERIFEPTGMACTFELNLEPGHTGLR